MRTKRTGQPLIDSPPDPVSESVLLGELIGAPGAEGYQAEAGQYLAGELEKYLRDLFSGRYVKHGLDQLQTHYDPQRSFAENARDPRAIEQAMTIAMIMARPDHGASAKMSADATEAMVRKYAFDKAAELGMSPDRYRELAPAIDSGFFTGANIAAKPTSRVLLDRLKTAADERGENMMAMLRRVLMGDAPAGETKPAKRGK